MLVEKAWAKLHGSYGAIEDCTAMSAHDGDLEHLCLENVLSILTGMPTFSFPLGDFSHGKSTLSVAGMSRLRLRRFSVVPGLVGLGADPSGSGQIRGMNEGFASGITSPGATQLGDTPTTAEQEASILWAKLQAIRARGCLVVATGAGMSTSTAEPEEGIECNGKYRGLEPTLPPEPNNVCETQRRGLGFTATRAATLTGLLVGHAYIVTNLVELERVALEIWSVVF
jgi:hypothetical protein